MIRSTVIDYIVDEVARQGHNVHALDGIERVGWMAQAWSAAIGMASCFGLGDIRDFGRMVEPRINSNGFRTCGIRVGSKVLAHDPKQIPAMLRELLADLSLRDSFDFYRRFEEMAAEPCATVG